MTAAHSMAGKTAVVTGATSGIGMAAAVQFAKLGADLAIVGRDPKRIADARAAVAAVDPSGRIQAFQADFGVFDDVRRLAGVLATAYPRIDVLANNAGALVPNRRMTADGFELTIEANHLAPFLLTNLLRDNVSGGRVITTASDAHRNGTLDPDDLNQAGTSYRPFRAYGTSKQANILFAAESARRWPDVFSASYHPGVVRTRFGNEAAVIRVFYKLAPWLKTPDQGADTMLWLAQTDPAELLNGGYYELRRLTRPTRAAADPDLARRLWQSSLTAVNLA